jgi:hypothetical protein
MILKKIYKLTTWELLDAYELTTIICNVWHGIL